MQHLIKKHTLVYALLSILFLFNACQKDDSFLTIQNQEESVVQTDLRRTYPGVEEALWPYFERFEEEGSKRNFEIDLVSFEITGVIENLEEENVAGQCNYHSHFPNHVTIDAAFWSRASDSFKEMIVFHELGHCVLARDHREGQLNNGNCVSIMRSGLEPCRDAYFGTNRTYYLDELFDSKYLNLLAN